MRMGLERVEEATKQKEEKKMLTLCSDEQKRNVEHNSKILMANSFGMGAQSEKYMRQEGRCWVDGSANGIADI